jgi:hypothetical protein
LFSWTSWTNNVDWDYDWGAVVLDRPVGAITGWYGWTYGGACPPSETYNVGAYPAEFCSGSLHNGQDMYYWAGALDSCHGNVQMHIDTGSGCTTALWGGESGSNIYRISGSSRYVRGIASTSDRASYGHYVEARQPWVDFISTDVIPNYARAGAFNLAALDMNISNTTVMAVTATTGLTHLATNSTNANPASTTYNYTVRLSSNDFITSSDTNLSSQNYSWDFGPVSSVTLNMAQVTIPENTAPGTYWLGTLYDSATDGNSGDNDTSDWDAQQITVTQETIPPSPSPQTWSVQPFEIDTSQISMTANTATDPSGGIEYYFDYTSSPTGGGGGSDSGWQASSSHTDTALGTNHNYCYRVRARDTYGNANTYSTTSCDYTRANPPGAAAFSNISTTSIQVNWTSNGNSVGTNYYAENTTQGTNSGWTTATTWVSTGLACGTTYSFRAEARNGDGVLTSWTSLGSASTLACTPDIIVSLAPDSTSVPLGGVLGYTVKVTNTTAVTQTFDYWTHVILPNGSKYPPAGELFGPVSVTLLPMDTRNAHLTHNIPGGAALGLYEYRGFVGAYPAITDQVSFRFNIVTSADQSVNRSDKKFSTSVDREFAE